jgi:hypothetical protein
MVEVMATAEVVVVDIKISLIILLSVCISAYVENP